jgi:hypothetical protein
MAENSYDYPMELDLSDEENETYEPKPSAQRNSTSKRSSIESNTNVPSRGADVGLICNVVSSKFFSSLPLFLLRPKLRELGLQPVAHGPRAPRVLQSKGMPSRMLQKRLLCGYRA